MSGLFVLVFLFYKKLIIQLQTDFIEIIIKYIENLVNENIVNIIICWLSVIDIKVNMTYVFNLCIFFYLL